MAVFWLRDLDWSGLWTRNRSRRRPRRYIRPPRRSLDARLQFELLESRELLSAAPLLHVGADGRHLLDSNDQPFYLVGDTAWSLALSVTESDASYYLQQRAAQGFNAVLIDSVGLSKIINGTSADRNGNEPFNGFLPGTSTYDVSTTPTAGEVTSSAGKYWQHIDNLVSMASTNGIEVVFDVYDTYSPWFQTNGRDGDSPSSPAKLQAYGQFLGQRYGDDDNIIWMFGNDYLASSAGDADMAAVIQGIRQFDNTHLITMEMDSAQGFPPAAFDNSTLRQYMTLNGIYLYNTGPYRSTYLEQYNRTDFGPTFNIETGYENNSDLGVTAATLRSGHYSFLLDGAIGDLYGNERVGGAFSGGPFAADWQSQLNSQGAHEMTYFGNLLNSVAWYNLVPDQDGTVFQGVGTPTDYSGARSLDGTLAIAYKPPSGTGGQSFTVHMNQFAGPVTAQWYDPTNGTYLNIGSGLANSGNQVFTSPSANSAGQNDFVLVLRAVTTAPATPTGLAATSGNGQVTLSWNAASGATSYNIYRATSAGGEGTTPYRTGITATSFTDTGLTNGTRYYYQLSAVNTAGQSGKSSEVSAVPQVPVANGLVLALGFNEGTGVTVTDSSGNNNSGTLSGATWSTSGKFGNALSFSGSSALVSIADSASLDLTTGMTLEAWVNPSTVASVWRDVIYKGPNDIYYLESSSTQAQAPAMGGTYTSSPLYATAPLAANTWSHLAATYDGAALRLYVNGVQVASRSQTGSIATSNGALSIGGDSMYGQYFAGRIDEVRIYNRALSTAQIQSDMNTAIGQSTDTQPPTAPASLVATAASTSQINLSWPAATDNVGVTGYRIERQNPGSTTYVQIGTSTGTTFNDTGLAAGTAYSYRVRAADAAGNLGGYSPVATATTVANPQPPAVPTGLAATSGNGQVTLSWNAASGATSYNIYRATSAGGEGTTPYRTGITATSFTDTGLTNGTRYYYQLSAVNTAGQSGKSSEVSAVPQVPVANGLVLALGFNEGTGVTVTDSSGNNNSGTLSGATWSTSGKFGNALSFSGSSALVSIADSASLDLTTGMTLEAWVNPSTVASVWRDVIYKGPNDIYYLESSSTQAQAPAMGGTYTSSPLYATAPLAANTWSHLAATYDGAALRLYVNGVQVASRSQTGSIATSNGALSIGGDSMYGQYFAGRIDEVRIYNRALSTAQIQSDMNTPVGSPLLLMGEMNVNSAGAVPLTDADVRPLLNEAVSRWQAALGDTPAARRLNQVRVDVTDLPNTTLGLAASTIIFVDKDAAGHGWFLDPTPWEDSEFVQDHASASAIDKVDLLSVLAHELGHILGFDDDHQADPFAANDVMADALPLSTRRIPSDDTPPVPTSVLNTRAVTAARADSAAVIPHPAYERVVDAPWAEFDPFDWLAHAKRKRLR